MKKTAYHLKNISHYYSGSKVLDIESLDIEKGSITGLIGPNGSGKSTLLKILAFADKPSKGIIHYNNRPETLFSPNIRSKITLLTQKPYLLNRSVFENIAYGLRIRKDVSDIKKRVKTALEDTGLDFNTFAGKKFHELSGGETQRVALAARLVLKPEVLLLDEPVASVDIKSAKLIRQAVLKAKEKWGTTLVIASHDLQWLFSISDRLYSLFKGRIFVTGHENIVPGPFEKKDENTFIKRLDDGQVISLPASEVREDFACIRTQVRTSFENGTDDRFTNRLKGKISVMLLEEKTGMIAATVMVQDLSFILKIQPDKLLENHIQPGSTIQLYF